MKTRKKEEEREQGPFLSNALRLDADQGTPETTARAPHLFTFSTSYHTPPPFFLFLFFLHIMFCCSPHIDFVRDLREGGAVELAAQLGRAAADGGQLPGGGAHEHLGLSPR